MHRRFKVSKKSTGTTPVAQSAHDAPVVAFSYEDTEGMIVNLGILAALMLSILVGLSG